MKPVEELVSAYISENILFSDNGFPYARDDSFLENGIVDSLGVVELVTFIEGKYDIAVNDEEIVPDNFDSVNKIAAFVRRKALQASRN